MKVKVDKDLIKYKSKLYLKRLLVLGLCGVTCASLFGCSKLEKDNLNLETDDEDTEETTDSTVSESTIKLENMNIANDTDAFITLDNQLNTDLSDVNNNTELTDEEKIEKNNLAIYDYVLNMVQLASSRLSSDIETVYTHSEDYMNYLAILQTFADSYSEETEEVQDVIINGKDTSDLKTYTALKTVQNYYIEVYENLNGSSSTTESESSDADDSKSEDSENSSTGSTSTSTSSTNSDGTGTTSSSSTSSSTVNIGPKKSTNN